MVTRKNDSPYPTPKDDPNFKNEVFKRKDTDHKIPNIGMFNVHIAHTKVNNNAIFLYYSLIDYLGIVQDGTTMTQVSCHFNDFIPRKKTRISSEFN